MRQPTTPWDVHAIRTQAVHVAVSNLGFGEVGGNNLGPFLKAIGARQGQPWCAYFAWYCYRRGAVHANLELPFRGSGNARQLGLRIAHAPHGWCSRELGMPITRDELAQHVLPGDLVVLARGPADPDGTGPGHARLVEKVLPDGRLGMIHGNSGPFPAAVCRITRDVTREDLVMVVGLR